MLSTEKCFDMLPYTVDIFEKLDLLNYIEANQVTITNTNKTLIDRLQKQAGMKLIAYILKNVSKVKEEAFNIVAIAQNKEFEEVKQQPIGETLKTFKDLLSNPETISFFKSAMQ